MGFGKRLKGLRKEQKISREDLCRELDVSYSSLAKYETGDRTPPPELLNKIADFFNVSTDYLFCRTNDRQFAKGTNHFSDRLKDLRRVHNLKLNELADKIGIQPRIMQFYEEIEEIPSLTALHKIADYFNVSIDWLLGKADNPERQSHDSSTTITELDDKEIKLMFRGHELSAEQMKKLRYLIENVLLDNAGETKG
jgi:transcriptional regulator with XRE-family HTH domain